MTRDPRARTRGTHAVVQALRRRVFLLLGLRCLDSLVCPGETTLVQKLLHRKPDTQPPEVIRPNAEYLFDIGAGKRLSVARCED